MLFTWWENRVADLVHSSKSLPGENCRPALGGHTCHPGGGSALGGHTCRPGVGSAGPCRTAPRTPDPPQSYRSDRGVFKGAARVNISHPTMGSKL